MTPRRTLWRDIATVWAYVAPPVGFLLMTIGAACLASWLTGGGDPAL